MSRANTVECFPDNLLGAVESTDEILARATTTGIHLMNQLNVYKHKPIGTLLSTEGMFCMDELYFDTDTAQLPLADYDDTYATTPTIHRWFDQSAEDREVNTQTFGPRESLMFHFFGCKDVRPLVPRGSVLLRSDGHVNFGLEQPFVEALPLDKPFGDKKGPVIEKMRLLQNIIHYGNRAALLSIGLAAANNLVEIPDETLEETAALQRRWLDIFIETAGQNYATHKGERYHPGIHLSLLSHYAVMDEY